MIIWNTKAGPVWMRGICHLATHLWTTQLVCCIHSTTQQCTDSNEVSKSMKQLKAGGMTPSPWPGNLPGRCHSPTLKTHYIPNSLEIVPENYWLIKITKNDEENESSRDASRSDNSAVSWISTTNKMNLRIVAVVVSSFLFSQLFLSNERRHPT